MDTGTAILLVGLVVVALLGVALFALFSRLRGVEGTRANSAELFAQIETESLRLRSAAQSDADDVRAAARREAEDLRTKAAADAADVKARAAAEAEKARERADEATAELREQRADLDRREQRLVEREERVTADTQSLEERLREVEAQAAELAVRTEELTALEAERRAVLERTAQLTAEQAKAELIAAVEDEAKRAAVVRVRDIEKDANENGQARAREIITLAIQRLASEQTAESVVSVLHLPGDEMKGRIIGREGRNIRAFEQVTGVNLIIDDTPEAVLLSCFDPVRREVARLTLEELVLDGRIHPHRIEEQYEKSKAEVEALCVRAGEDALVEVGVTDMHPDLVALLGRLRYRTSYGQNVLKHLIESAHLAGMMAGELGLDVKLTKRCALLHDIGKALTHEVDGSHALIGAEIARRYGENDDVVHAIEAHHNEVELRTVEAVLTQAADAISGGRPGARRESLEAYVKRLERLEEISMSHEGVEKVFAMQAGREVRVMVLPDVVDDIQAQVLARDIAKQVEEELTYPGQIRITVVRESRSTEFAR
ncbi:ribonuclease Y [Jiangella aurantiaca]|uniref:Ribonuclease Y n=1 Tax=Jiangella aurantiaca TaxID=2530373 RepID=A0A4R5AD56_9ACTN|nr:ribonuclease Y [Jiangella aurantiaca]TDD68764.1 ribonuclease Y [Jiangella aurantiaca]